MILNLIKRQNIVVRDVKEIKEGYLKNILEILILF